MTEARANKMAPSARARRRQSEGGETRRYNQHIAGMSPKLRARRERILQEQLYNARVNVLARFMVNWFIADEKGEEDRQTALLPDINRFLRTFTSGVAERIRDAAAGAAEAQILAEQAERIKVEQTPTVKAEPVPFTQEELDAFAAI